MQKMILVAATLGLVGSMAAAEGDAAKGERVFKKCAACHTVEPGKKKPGPHLQNILGRSAASVEGFKYSKAMIEAGLTWDEETLRAFLAAPKKFVPKTKMSFPGIKKDGDLEDLISYMKGL